MAERAGPFGTESGYEALFPLLLVAYVLAWGLMVLMFVRRRVHFPVHQRSLIFVFASVVGAFVVNLLGCVNVIRASSSTTAGLAASTDAFLLLWVVYLLFGLPPFYFGVSVRLTRLSHLLMRQRYLVSIDEMAQSQDMRGKAGARRLGEQILKVRDMRKQVNDKEIFSESFGFLMLPFIAIGVIGYAMWLLYARNAFYEDNPQGVFRLLETIEAVEHLLFCLYLGFDVMLKWRIRDVYAIKKELTRFVVVQFALTGVMLGTEVVRRGFLDVPGIGAPQLVYASDLIDVVRILMAWSALLLLLVIPVLSTYRAPPPPPTEKEAEKLAQTIQKIETILTDMRGRHAFQQYLMESFAVEFLLFWYAVENYKRLTSKRDRSIRAKALYQQFVRKQADFYVDLLPNQRKHLEFAHAKATPETFSNAQDEVFSVMKHMYFPRFVRSPLGAKLNHELITVDRERVGPVARNPNLAPGARISLEDMGLPKAMQGNAGYMNRMTQIYTIDDDELERGSWGEGSDLFGSGSEDDYSDDGGDGYQPRQRSGVRNQDSGMLVNDMIAGVGRKGTLPRLKERKGNHVRSNSGDYMVASGPAEDMASRATIDSDEADKYNRRTVLMDRGEADDHAAAANTDGNVRDDADMDSTKAYAAPGFSGERLDDGGGDDARATVLMTTAEADRAAAGFTAEDDFAPDGDAPGQDNRATVLLGEDEALLSDQALNARNMPPPPVPPRDSSLTLEPARESVSRTSSGKGSTASRRRRRKKHGEGDR